MSQLNATGSWWWEVISNNNIELTMAVVIVSVLIMAILRSKLSSSPSLPPGPRSIPIIGYLPFLDLDNFPKQLANMAKTYGPIFKFYVGSKLFIVVNNADLAKVVLREQDKIFANRKPTIAGSIITYGGQDMTYSNNSSTQLRKMFSQVVLNNKNLDASRYFRRDAVRETVKTVYGKIGSTVNISEISFSAVANVVTSMTWGNSPLGAEFQTVSSKIFQLIATANISDFFPSFAWFDIQGIERDTKIQHKKLDMIFSNIINSRLKLNAEKSDDVKGHEGRTDLLQMFLELNDKKVLDLHQIKGLILDMMIGGTDSTSTLIQWAMAEILKDHKVLKRVQEELAEVVGVNNIVEESHLRKLPYLDAAIKETLRLHPVGPLLVPRLPSENCVVGGYIVPKGCAVSINVWAIHRDPSHWDNPLEFNPDRFLNNEARTKYDLLGNNLNYNPFGSGRRMCPGLELADHMEMYIVASLLHSFDWTLPKGEKHDVSEKFGIVLKKRKPLIVIPSPRLPSTSLYE